MHNVVSSALLQVQAKSSDVEMTDFTFRVGLWHHRHLTNTSEVILTSLHWTAEYQRYCEENRK